MLLLSGLLVACSTGVRLLPQLPESDCRLSPMVNLEEGVATKLLSNLLLENPDHPLSLPRLNLHQSLPLLTSSEIGVSVKCPF